MLSIITMLVGMLATTFTTFAIQYSGPYWRPKFADKCHRAFWPTFVIFVVGATSFYITAGVDQSTPLVAAFVAIALFHRFRQPQEEKVRWTEQSRPDPLSKASNWRLLIITIVGSIASIVMASPEINRLMNAA